MLRTLECCIPQNYPSEMKTQIELVASRPVLQEMLDVFSKDTGQRLRSIVILTGQNGK